MGSDIRWKQRFQNFEKAYHLLREPFEGDASALSDLEKQGVIQRFEMAEELSWKTLKDYLEFQGIHLAEKSARNIFKEAFAVGILKEGQVWIDMVNHRNALSHCYDAAAFEEAIEEIEARYLQALGELHQYLSERTR